MVRSFGAALLPEPESLPAPPPPHAASPSTRVVLTAAKPSFLLTFRLPFEASAAAGRRRLAMRAAPSVSANMGGASSPRTLPRCHVRVTPPTSDRGRGADRSGRRSADEQPCADQPPTLRDDRRDLGAVGPSQRPRTAGFRSLSDPAGRRGTGTRRCTTF